MPICIKCGSQNPTEAEYCFKCGARIYRESSPEYPTPMEEVPASRDPIEPDTYRRPERTPSGQVESRPAPKYSKAELQNARTTYFLVGIIVAIASLYLLFCFDIELRSTDYFHLFSGEMTIYDIACESGDQIIVIICVILALGSIIGGCSFIPVLGISSPVLIAIYNDNVISKLDMEIVNGDSYLFAMIAVLILSIIQQYLLYSFKTRFSNNDKSEAVNLLLTGHR